MIALWSRRIGTGSASSKVKTFFFLLAFRKLNEPNLLLFQNEPGLSAGLFGRVRT